MATNLRDLIPEQEPAVIAENFEFTEGPVWHPDGYLLFSDIPANTISATSPAAARNRTSPPAAIPTG